MKHEENEVVRKFIETSPHTTTKSAALPSHYRLHMTEAKAFTQLKDGSLVEEEDLSEVIETVKALVTVLRVAADHGKLNPDRLEVIGSILKRLSAVIH
ncbi:hypothetical protein L4X63_22555 [Geomonas sp. Red32]|uniref:hypothetical protein n=1 Tax=Geomonas sp. Red32 TaxID=2912856 RepID=UPI00202CFC1A|nr:hypothetical protein [Geomonas sp. Red32]MCM0084371.1 hypothetical protein [Geomonas sp. Red32]